MLAGGVVSNLEKLKAELDAVRQKKRDLDCAEALLMLLICREENPEKAKLVSMTINVMFPTE